MLTELLGSPAWEHVGLKAEKAPALSSPLLRGVCASLGIAELLGTHEKLSDGYMLKYSKSIMVFVIVSTLSLLLFAILSLKRDQRQTD